MNYDQHTELSKQTQKTILINYCEYYLNLDKFEKKNILKGIRNTLIKRDFLTSKQFRFLLSWMRFENEFKHLTESTVTELFKDIIDDTYSSSNYINKGNTFNTLSSFLDDSDSLQPLYIQSEVQIIR